MIRGIDSALAYLTAEIAAMVAERDNLRGDVAERDAALAEIAQTLGQALGYPEPPGSGTATALALEAAAKLTRVSEGSR